MGCDFVLLHPESRTRIYQALGDSLAAIETPIWAAMLASALRQAGAEVAIVDMAAEDLSVAEAAKRINALHPRFAVAVVYAHQPSASTHNMTVAGEVLRQVDGPTVMLGGHPSALPEQTLREERCTYVAVGEGLETLLGLFHGVEVPHVPGLVYWDGPRCAKNPVSALESSLDLDGVYPLPAFDLLPMGQYRAYNWMAWGYPSRQLYVAFYGSLGCNFACNFCAVQSPFYAGQTSGNVRRHWSPRWIGNTLEHLVTRYGVTHVRIADEMFLFGKAWVAAICEEIIRRSLTVNLYVYARADTCQDRPLLDLMKRAGFNWVCIGFESASERVRTTVGKRYSQATALTAARHLHEAGINLLANHIVGLRGETLEDMQATVNEAMIMLPEFWNLYAAVPYPGSPLYTQAVKEGWPLPSRWEDYAQHAPGFTPHGTEMMTPAEVVAFRDQAWRDFFTHPAYVSKIEREFGLPARQEVEAMTAIRLERVRVH